MNRNIRANEQIRAPKVRLISENGDQVGIVSIDEALTIANERELDLVEVSPNANPPVCKVMDYGKYKYQQEIAEKEKKKKQTQIVVKEIKLRTKIDTNDLNTKKRHIEKFLKNGNKVKVTIMFKGREIVHKELGQEILNDIIKEFQDKSIIEQTPKLDGYNMTMVMGPL